MKPFHKPCSLGIVITGGSSGLGYALAREFLLAGDRVVICARNPERLEAALSSLRRTPPRGEIFAMVCDVRDHLAVKAFALFAAASLGTIDRWINNAGTAGQLKRPLWELQSDDILETSATNLSGTLFMCAEALRLMAGYSSAGEARYHIFNMGFSALGAFFSRSAVPHKASKRGVAEVSRFLARELKAAGKTAIGVHELSPGLVLTDLLLRDASPESRVLLDVIAEKPETVAALLVPKIRTVTGRKGTIRYQPLLGLFFRMLIATPRILRAQRSA